MTGERHNVIAFPQTEVVNGVRMALGRMSLDQLLALEEECHERMVEAQVDYQHIQDVRMHRFPNDGGAA